MSYTFEKAAPVKIEGTGAKKIENPFIDAVKSIAWKDDEKTGLPEALSFSEEHDTDDTKSYRSRVVARLSAAGDALDKPGTVRRAFADVTNDKGEVIGTKTTFWVVEKRAGRKVKAAE